MTDIVPPENTEFLIHIMSGAHKQSYISSALSLQNELEQKIESGEIEKADTKNSVEAEDLSSADQKKLMNNFQKSQLYKLVQSYSNSLLTSSIKPSTSSSNSILSNATSSSSILNNKTTKEDDIKDNEILTYDSKNTLLDCLISSSVDLNSLAHTIGGR